MVGASTADSSLCDAALSMTYATRSTVTRSSPYLQQTNAVDIATKEGANFAYGPRESNCFGIHGSGIPFVLGFSTRRILMWSLKPYIRQQKVLLNTRWPAGSLPS